MFKKITFQALGKVLIICFVVVVSMMFGTGFIRKGAGDVGLREHGLAEDYRIEVMEPGQRILIEQVREEPVVRVDPKETRRKYRSSVEVFTQAMAEVEKRYNVHIYSACPILEPGYPPVQGSWTRALILFVEPKNNGK